MARSLAAMPASYVRGTRMLRDFANDADPAFFHLQFKREQILFTRSLSRARAGRSGPSTGPCRGSGNGGPWLRSTGVRR